MIYSDELRAVAKRIFWSGTPEEALEFPLRFLTYAMTNASDEDIEILIGTTATRSTIPQTMPKAAPLAPGSIGASKIVPLSPINEEKQCPGAREFFRQ
jgi:hypothetical protein